MADTDAEYASDIPDDDDSNRLKGVVRRAHRRWRKCRTREAVARDRWLKDYRFAHGDSYNNDQWLKADIESRGDRPTLTVNETRQHNLHITNEAKQNKSSVKYRPVGDGASIEAAEVFEGLYRHIQNISNAQMAQGMAIDFQVDAGLGWTIVRSDYVNQDSFDQELYIRGVPDPLAVILDCDARELDGSDARYGFVFADRPRDEVIEEYPQFRGRAAPQNAVSGDDSDMNDGWLREDHIREAEYYEVSEDRDELMVNDAGNMVYRSEIGGRLARMWKAEAKAKGGKLRTRPIIRKSVTCYKIIGDEVVEETDIPGTTVPIIPWVGEVVVIDGIIDRKGHTRGMVSAQRMENYNWSAVVEYGGLQSKTPYVAPAKAIEGHETYWNTANTVNHAWIPYNHLDDMGNPIPPPTRQQPPASAPVYMDGVTLARQFMLSASGQYEAVMGAPGNERSGRAINERQRQGERATYHFIDNQALAIRRQGQIIKEWIPVIYDTPRVLRILGEDGEESHVQLDPEAKAAMTPIQQAEDERKEKKVQAVTGIFNPNVGTYEVVSDVGPDWATQRQEAFAAIIEIITQAPQLITQIGDLLFKVADFPLADQIAERLKPGLSPEAQAAVAQLQQQLQAGNKALGEALKMAQSKEKLLAEAMAALSEERLKTRAKDSDNVIDAFDADTKRMAALKDYLPLDMNMLKRVIREVMAQNMQDNLGPAVGDLMDSVRAFGDEDAAGSGAALPLSVPDPGRASVMIGGV